MAGAPKKRAVKKLPTKKKTSTTRAKETGKTARSRPAPPKAAAAKAARETPKATAKKAAKKKKIRARTKERRPEKAPVRRTTAEGKRARETPEATPRVTEERRVKGRAPSERAAAVFAELPTERSLTDEEREAMSKVSETARRFVGAEGPPSRVVERIAQFVADVRRGKCEEPKSQDVRLGLGVLWGEQLKAQAGWSWVHLTYPDGFASYALVPDDRAFACFPLNRVPEAFQPNVTDTSGHVFDSIKGGALPARKPNAYLVLG